MNSPDSESSERKEESQKNTANQIPQEKHLFSEKQQFLF